MRVSLALLSLLLKGSLAKIVLMHTHWGQAIKHTIHGTDALFGFPVFGDYVSGTVARAGSGCHAVPPGTWDEKIVLVQRGGGCSYVNKVLAAQRGGALAVMVGDDQDEPETELPVMTDELEGGGGAVQIPSMFISKQDVAYIAEHMAKAANPNVEADTGVMTASISWNFKAKGRGATVRWEFWSSSFEPRAFDLKRGGMWAQQSVLDDLSLFAVALSPAASFEPRYYTVPGRLWQCTTAAHGAPFDAANPHCGRQCSNSGRYCVVDRGGKSEASFDGIDIISENVRQLCANDGVNANQPKRWWKYVVGFAKQCSKAKSPIGCSRRLMKEVGIDVAAVEACVAKAGGTAMAGPENVLLEEQLRKQETERIERPPKLVINGEHFVGRLDCPHPIKPSRCPPLGAICSAFSVAHKPKACADGYWDGSNAWTPAVGGGEWIESASKQVPVSAKSHAEPALLPDILLKTAAGKKIDCAKVQKHCHGPSAMSTRTNPGTAHWHALCRQAFGLCSVAEVTEAAFSMTGSDPETQIVQRSSTASGGGTHGARASSSSRSSSNGGGGGVLVWVVVACMLGGGFMVARGSGGNVLYTPLPSSAAYDTIQTPSPTSSGGSESGLRKSVKSGKDKWLED